MKKIILVFVLFLAFTSSCTRIQSTFNTSTKQIICTGSVCIHEIGHFIDQSSGWVSKTKEFRDTFKNAKNADTGTLYKDLFKSGNWWDMWQEFYANVFYNYFGCENLMPETIRKFFDFDTSNSMMDHMVFDTKTVCPQLNGN